MITAIISFITAMPALLNGANAFASKYFDTKAQLVASRLGADVSVIKAAMQAAGIEQQAGVDRLKVIASSRVLLFLVVGFALPFMLYEWQCIVYDKLWMQGLHATDPIRGNLADWGNTIIVSLFGSGTAATMAHMYFNRSKAGE